VTDARIDHGDLDSLVQGLGLVDWTQARLIANLPPARRIVPGMRAQAFAMAAVRGALRRKFPKISRRELNVKVLKHFTPVRIPDTECAGEELDSRA
jgi:hypothetical protein